MTASSLVLILSFIGISAASDPSVADPNCGGVLSGPFGTISSPERFLSQPEHCEWIIRGVVDEPREVHFESMTLEASPKCVKGFIELRELRGDTYDRLLGRYCGPVIPPVVRTTPGDSVKVIFHSDGSLSQGSGFKIRYDMSQGHGPAA